MARRSWGAWQQNPHKININHRKGPPWRRWAFTGRAATGGSRRAANWTRLSPPPLVVGYLGVVHTGSCLSTLFDVFLFFSICAIRVRPPTPKGRRAMVTVAARCSPHPLGRWCKYAPPVTSSTGGERHHTPQQRMYRSRMDQLSWCLPRAGHRNLGPPLPLPQGVTLQRGLTAG